MSDSSYSDDETDRFLLSRKPVLPSATTTTTTTTTTSTNNAPLPSATVQTTPHSASSSPIAASNVHSTPKQDGDAPSEVILMEPAPSSSPPSVTAPADNNTPNHATQGHLMRPLYKVWPGRNILCFCGRIILGPDIGVLMCSLMSMALPSILWFIFVLPVVASQSWGLAIYIVAAVLVAGCLFFLVKVATADPGIIPRAPKPMLAPGQVIPRYKSVSIHGVPVKMKWCAACNIYRPPRASHCARCDNCVLRFDHHCPWTGTDIGELNYRWFILFVAFAALLSVTCLISCIEAVRINGVDTESNGWVAVVLIIYSLAFLCFTGPLCLYHSYLVCSDTTTRESLKGMRAGGIYKRRRCCASVMHIFLTPGNSLVGKSMRQHVRVASHESRDVLEMVPHEWVEYCSYSSPPQAPPPPPPSPPGIHASASSTSSVV